jgi:hypothetical protein
MEEVVMTLALNFSPEPLGSIAACSKGRKATVVK